jgi:ATP-dependent DNA helicase RecG
VGEVPALLDVEESNVGGEKLCFSSAPSCKFTAHQTLQFTLVYVKINLSIRKRVLPMFTNEPLSVLKGVGARQTALYEKLGVRTVGDLLRFYPRDYIDYSRPIPVADALTGETAAFRCTVVFRYKPVLARHITIYKAQVEDEAGDLMTVVFFNAEYRFLQLIVGKTYIFRGKVSGNAFECELQSPTFIPEENPARMIPKYRLVNGLGNGHVINAVRQALAGITDADVADCFPPAVLERYSLIDSLSALRQIHFPQDNDSLAAAKKRLAFDELTVLQLGMVMLKNRNRSLTGAVMDDQDFAAFYGSLPFELTGAQKRAVADCAADLQKHIPMNRLLQGDVGSGKTAVAAALCWFAHKNGFQTALMAPTDVLARQHFATLNGFLSSQGIKIALLSGSQSAAEKREQSALAASGEAGVVVGTHALIQKTVSFKNLGLIIADEQHRFGVRQRGELANKGENPHVLVMSATPIPRTLALLIYADLDISVLDEMPKGRLPVQTFGVDVSFHERLYRFVLKRAAAGEQVFIVCPMIEEGSDQTRPSAQSETAAAAKYCDFLRENWFGSIGVGLLHGRMKPDAKETVMNDFVAKKFAVLVSTTVIEVGVDIPNATVMIIENAERFGLSQLHQLRGRVGRGNRQSYCIMVFGNNSEYSQARRDIMVGTNDGFAIANEDLRLRGPGDFFGAKQHGLPELRCADMVRDVELAGEARQLAEELLSSDPRLREPDHWVLQERVHELFKEKIDNGFN